MPREAPVTSAQPRSPLVGNRPHRTTRPFHLSRAGAPHGASAEGTDQDASPGTEHSVPFGEVHRQRQRRSRCVAQGPDAIDHAFDGKFETLADRAGYACIRLVIHEDVNVLDPDPPCPQNFERDLAERVDCGPERVLAAHPDEALFVSGHDELGLAAV